MKDFTANELLKIVNPCEIFSNDIDVAKSEFKTLSMKFHPDRYKESNANDVFVHIKDMYTKSVELIEQGKWEIPFVVYVTDEHNTTYRIGFRKKHKFELGEMYISKTVIAYVLDKDHIKFYENYLRNVKSFKYANEDMKKEFSRYLPTIKKNFKCKDSRFVIVVSKTPDQLLLKDVYDHYNSKGYPVAWDKHVAWMQSRLNNLLCYFKFNGIVNNSISLETIFISPEYHSVAILGGWWFTTNIGEKMIAVPSHLYNSVPPTVRASKLASCTTDGEFVKALGRKLLEKAKAPKAFQNWLEYGAGDDPFKEYETWHTKILKESYGERKFIHLDLKWEDVYE